MLRQNRLRSLERGLLTVKIKRLPTSVCFLSTPGAVSYSLFCGRCVGQRLARSRCSIKKEGRERAHSCDTVSQLYIQKEWDGSVQIAPSTRTLGMKGELLLPGHPTAPPSCPLQHFGPRQGRTSPATGKTQAGHSEERR